jgi:hypothetical protein
MEGDGMLLVNGNTKLGNGIWHFSLPAEITCKPTQWCKENCYAKKGTYVFQTVQNALRYRLVTTYDDDFVQRIAGEIHALRVKRLRVHASGDFYSNDYVHLWEKIAQDCPDTTFMAFTRRGDFKESIMRLADLPNFKVRESLDDTSPEKEFRELYSAVIAGSPWDFGQHKCHGRCNECLYCWTRDGDVVMKIH